MAKWQAAISGTWITDPDGQRSKQLSRDYAGVFISDTTGQQNVIPDPNLVTMLVTCEASVLDAIEINGTYLVLWSEEIVEGGF